MKQKREARQPDDTSSYLGILEGNKARAESDAAIALEQQKRATLLLQAKLSEQGYDPAADANAAEAASNKTTMYIVIGSILILVVGLIFIVKRRRK